MATDSEPRGDLEKSKSKSDIADELPKHLGRYLLLRRIARGGMGEVFLGATTGVEGAERPVVVKIIRRDHAADPSFLARFLDEARVQAQLQHSGVAQVLEASIDPESGEPFAAVEHVEGRSLGDLRGRAVSTGKQIAWADAVALATLISEALAHVHERKDTSGEELAIVHRDLSPQNVMVSYAGDVKVIDFGTARGQNRRCHTVAGVVFAKPGYVAPEVANGDSGDAKVDVYALGVMLWELCAGRRFLQGDANVHMAAVGRNAKSLPAIAASIGAPEELDVLLGKLTAFDKRSRPSSRVAANDLAKLLAHAEELASGERSIRARTAELMRALFPSEPQASRREFQKLLASAQRTMKTREAAPTIEPEAPVEASSPGAEPAVGEMLSGTRYKLLGEIGRGSSSVVYEAEHVDLGRRVAIKVLAEIDGVGAAFSDRFRREARALSRLSHAHLVAVHDVGLSGGRVFCVMDLLDGETVESYLAREKGADYREALALADKALAALEVAHGANLVHRDIKPANLFLTEGGGLKVLDFGVAKTECEASSASQHGALFGTPEYMAPEQAASGPVDARADLYALGCVLYEMMTGELPFAGPSAVAILDAKKKGSPEPMRLRTPTRGIPAAVDELVLKALARNASARFQTASAMREAIATAMGVQRARRSSRRFVAFAAVAAATLAFAFVAGASKLGRTERFAASAPTASITGTLSSDEGGVDVMTGVLDPNDSWARAERGEDEITPEASPADEAPAASEPVRLAVADTDASKGPVRAHPRKRKGDLPHKAKGPKRVVVKPSEPEADDTKDPAVEADDTLDTEARAKTQKRHKKKTRVAHIDET